MAYPIHIARRLRSTMTPAEKVLWKKLRAHRFHGEKFKRQVPIGRYVVDFACLKKKLVIEIDGSVHLLKIESDRIREMHIQSKGFTVIRFSNGQVFHNLDWVLEEIFAHLQIPLPPGEG